MKWTRAIERHLDALQRKGYIRRAPDKSRGIQLVVVAHIPKLFANAGTKRSLLMKSIDRIRAKFGYRAAYFGIVDPMERTYHIHRSGLTLHAPLLSR